MTTLPSGFNFTVDPLTGIAFNICWTIDTITDPEYPLPPFSFGTPATGLDNSGWVFVKPASRYSIGTIGYIDSSWNFTAITTANATNAIGSPVGVLSQIASVTQTPTSTLYDGVWAQVNGLSPAINVAASTTAFAPLYTSTTAGRLTSVSGGQLMSSVVIITSSTSAGNQPGILA